MTQVRFFSDVSKYTLTVNERLCSHSASLKCRDTHSGIYSSTALLYYTKVYPIYASTPPHVRVKFTFSTFILFPLKVLGFTYDTRDRLIKYDALS